MFSRTLRDVTWDNTRVIRELDVDEIVALKRRPGAPRMA